jgi:hypothetical protein
MDKKVEKRRKNWYRQYKNSEILHQYKSDLKNKLKDGVEAENIETYWKKVEDIIRTIAVQHLGKKKRVKTWMV